MDGGRDGDDEPGLDRSPDPRRSGRPEAGDRRDPRRLLLSAAAAAADDGARPEDRSGVGSLVRSSAVTGPAGDRRAQPRDDRATHLEAVHAQPAARELLAAGP